MIISILVLMFGSDQFEPRQYYVRSQVESAGGRYQRFPDLYSRVTLESPGPTISPLPYVPLTSGNGPRREFEPTPADRTNLQLWMADPHNWCPSWACVPTLDVDIFLYFEAVLKKDEFEAMESSARLSHHYNDIAADLRRKRYVIRDQIGTNPESLRLASHLLPRRMQEATQIDGEAPWKRPRLTPPLQPSNVEFSGDQTLSRPRQSPLSNEVPPSFVRTVSQADSCSTSTRLVRSVSPIVFREALRSLPPDEVPVSQSSIRVPLSSTSSSTRVTACGSSVPDLNSAPVQLGAPTRNHLWHINPLTGQAVLVRRPRSRGLKRESARTENQTRLTNLAQRLGRLHDGASPMSGTRYGAHHRLGYRNETSVPHSRYSSSYSQSWGGRSMSSHNFYQNYQPPSTAFWPKRLSDRLTPPSRPLY